MGKLKKYVYNLGMNIKTLENRSLLFFGKSRAFAKDEFEAQMLHHNITILKEYSSEVKVVVEGRMMTPYEQNDSAALYESQNLEFISIDVLERLLAQNIDEDTLLMSLKLSHDKERLKEFLTNSMISETLFFKLLKIYSWGGEDFFENDENRDVTAALIGRFYENIERNHNVQYATHGLMHLIAQTKNADLIEVISELEPLERSFNSSEKSANFSILSAIATHSASSVKVLKRIIKRGSSYLKTLVAMRSDCDAKMQEILFNDGDESVLEALSYNSYLSRELITKLSVTKKYAKNIATFVKLNESIFVEFLEDYSVDLAANETLDFSMQERLIELHEDKVRVALASNSHIEEKFINELVSEGSADINFAIYENIKTPQTTLEVAYENEINHFALSYNENTPKHLLKLLAQSSDERVLKGVAKNESTPVEVLYQLQLDSRFERDVKENKAFGKHIQSENIGWLV